MWNSIFLCASYVAQLLFSIANKVEASRHLRGVRRLSISLTHHTMQRARATKPASAADEGILRL